MLLFAGSALVGCNNPDKPKPAYQTTNPPMSQLTPQQPTPFPNLAPTTPTNGNAFIGNNGTNVQSTYPYNKPLPSTYPNQPMQPTGNPGVPIQPASNFGGLPAAGNTSFGGPTGGVAPYSAPQLPSAPPYNGTPSAFGAGAPPQPLPSYPPLRTGN
jgi:hypothetical protein